MENVQEIMDDVENGIPVMDENGQEQKDTRSDWIKGMTFTEDDMNALKETIPTLNFIELESMKRDLKNTQIQLEAAKEYADNFHTLEKATQSDDSLSKKIALSDAEEKVSDAIKVSPDDELKSAVIEFLEGYEETMSNIETIRSLIDKTLDEKYGDAKKTTTFLTDCTIDMLTKRVDNLGDLPENPSTAYEMASVAYKQELNELIRIFKRRNKVDEIVELLPKSQQSLVRLKRDLKNDPKGIKLNGTKQAVGKNFGKVMSVGVLQNAEAFLTKHIGEENTFYLVYALYSLHWRLMEKKDVRFKCIELFFTNCADIYAGIYDYCGGPQEWISNVKELTQKVNQMLKK